MQAVQVALLTVTALMVGALIPVLFQLYFTLRQLQNEVHEARMRIEPVLERLSNVSSVAAAVATSVAAGVRVYREANRDTTKAGAEKEEQ